MNQQYIVENIRETTPHGGIVSPHVLISETARLTKPARAYGNAEILGESQVLGESLITDFAKVLEHAIVNSSTIGYHARVGGYASVDKSRIVGTAEVRGRAIVYSSLITDNAIVTDHAQVHDCHIGCNARVLGNAKLYNVHFRALNNDYANNIVIVGGDAVLDFVPVTQLEPGTRVTEGYWQRPPLVLDTPVFTMTEGVGDRIQIGCQNRSIEFWRKKGWDALVKYGLDTVFYKDFEEAVDKMEAFKKQHGSPDIPIQRKSK